MHERVSTILSGITSCRSTAMLALVAGLAVSGPAVAQQSVYTAPLSGSAVVPPTASTATGFMTLTVDLNLKTMAVAGSFFGLGGGAATAAHVHCCAPTGTNSAVAIPFPGFPSTTSGAYNVTLDMTLTSSYAATFLTNNGGTASQAFDALVAGMNVGASYVDIHDSVYPGGEIRGVPTPSPILQSAVSRKVHGGAGTFDLPLTLVPVTNPTTEPRLGPAQTIVLIFNQAITAATATITEGTATAAAPTFSGNDVIVGLTGVTNKQYVTVALTNVASSDGGSGGSGSVRIGFLAGDVNQNRAVTVSDLVLVNNQIAHAVTAANYLKDLNASGAITVGDKVIANANVAKALPAP
jgi:hypothetical protein